MPKGITQEQVSAAADALVADGENPTVEKVRAALGTGSPNTVTRMLDVWRTQLGGRLRQLRTIPGLPDDVGLAMTELWRLAVEHADGVLRDGMTERRAELEALATRLAEERAQWSATLAEAETAVAQARMQRDLAEHACSTLDDQLQDSHALSNDLQQQRDRLQAQVDLHQADLQAMRIERTALDAAIREDRERQAEHVRQVENRAHQEVDRVRQDAKALRQEMERMQRGPSTGAAGGGASTRHPARRGA